MLSVTPAILAETPEDAAYHRLQGTCEFGDVASVHAPVVPQQQHPHLGVCHFGTNFPSATSLLMRCTKGSGINDLDSSFLTFLTGLSFVSRPVVLEIVRLARP